MHKTSSLESSQLGELLYRPLFGILSSTAGLKFSIRLKIEVKYFQTELWGIHYIVKDFWLPF